MSRWLLQQTCQLPRVCSPAVTLLYKKGLRHRRKICVNSLWLYSYFTQTSPLKNKNIYYIFTYLRGLRCLSSGTICDTTTVLRWLSYKITNEGWYAIKYRNQIKYNFKITSRLFEIFIKLPKYRVSEYT